MINPNKVSQSRNIRGSFRDPSGYVFERDGLIYRAVDETCAGILKELEGSGLLAQLIDQERLVGTSILDDSNLVRLLASEHSGYGNFLKHDRIDTITYPNEWTISMLADAAVHTIDIQLMLLEGGLSLKDASAYNIQFIGFKPVFIDLSSIERPERRDLWIALGQFEQMFTYPILLCRYYGWDLASYFVGQINGRSVERVAQSIGMLGCSRPSVFLDVTLPLILDRWARNRDIGGREMMTKSVKNSGAQVANLKRLRRKVQKISNGYKPRGVWTEYGAICNYNERASVAKRNLVKEYLDRVKPSWVLDMGCNVGEFSYIAAECGSDVLAADADHDAVEVLYRRLKEKPAAITPMVIDLSNPSPATGFRNQERMSFLERLDVDCVMVLALFHHLHVSGNLPVESIRDLFWDMTNDYLILEFIPPEDEMFRRLLKFRVDLYGGLNLDKVRKVFLYRFDIIQEKPIPGSLRTLLLLKKTRTKE
jgi:SAM-dependent methyltransferase